MRLFVLLSLLASIAFAQQQSCVSATGRQVSVDGSASIAMRPDRLSFTVGVDTTAPNVGDAFRRNSDKVNAVISALKARGLAQTAIQTSNFDVDDTHRKTAGYRVNNTVTVTLDEPSRVGELVEAAIAAGANEAGDIRMFIADPGKHSGRGLEMAFSNAREKAQKLAALSGRALGDVVCVSDTSRQWWSAGYGYSTANNTATANSFQVALGQEALTFGVSVVFELK